MCTLLDGKTYELLDLNIKLFEALRKEAHRLNLKLDTSEISQVITEAQNLIVHPTTVNTRYDPTESYQNPPLGSAKACVGRIVVVTVARSRNSAFPGFWRGALVSTDSQTGRSVH